MDERRDYFSSREEKGIGSPQISEDGGSHRSRRCLSIRGIGMFRACLFCLGSAGLKNSRTGNQPTHRLISRIAKDFEAEKMFGISMYFLGVYIAALSPGGIDPPVTAMGILLKSWAAMSGSTWGGKRTRFGKSVAVSQECIFVSLRGDYLSLSFFLRLV